MPVTAVIADINEILFKIAQALRIPVILLALAALAITLVELGSLTVELIRRRKRRFEQMEAATAKARTFMAGGWIEQAIVSLRPVTWSNRMERTMEQLVPMIPGKRSEDRISKTLADFDYESLKRLERTRVLVRAGPALGLMGTLIPLAPGLAALAQGDVAELTLNLRLAFSITILGLLIGAVAFSISLIRDRLYGQDLSDLEYMVAMIDPGGETATEGELVRALGRARRRPGRHSRPEDDHDRDDDDIPVRQVPGGPPPDVIPRATDTPGVRAGDSTTAQAAGPAHAGPPGVDRATAPDPMEDRDYLAELTMGLGDPFGDEHTQHDIPPNGESRRGAAGSAESGRAPAADEEERR
jgi:biopolymer transport protein ExbB/TolQ